MQIKAWVSEGKNTSGELVGEEMLIEIEETTSDVFPGMFSTPVTLTADTEYCFGDK